MTTWRIAARGAALLVLPAVLAGARGLEAQTTTVLLVRHAEPLATDDRDPALSPAGEARAAALADALADAGVAAIYATPFHRTQDTAAPLAARLGLDVRTTPVENGVDAHVRDVARRVRAENPGGVVLVVGHSNTVPRIVSELTGTKVPDLAEYEFGDLFIVELPASGPARLIHARFGADATRGG